MKTTIAQFIPIILIAILLSYSREFVEFSQNMLGKITGLAIVLFYTYLDKYVGLVLCLILIIYYQSDFVENMLNTDDIMNKMFENFEQQKIKEVKEKMSTIEPVKPKQSPLSESMSTITDVYPVKKLDEDEDEEEEEEGMNVINKFRQDNCKGTQLIYKHEPVKPDMVGHIFPNIQFNRDKCNPCDNGCDISIIENRLIAENELISKSSRDT